MSRVKRVLAAAVISAVMVGAGALPALADDHLFTAQQNGKPNLGNSDPGAVPGLGDPKVGAKQGTPASDNAKGGCCQNDHPRQSGQKGGQKGGGD